MENYNNLSETLKKHLKSITESSGLPDTEESLEKISSIWFKKKNMFEEQIKALDMIETDSFKSDDKRAALMLTYSGSLISLGPLHDNIRWVEYYSIKLRGDVPDIIKKDDAEILNDTVIDNSLEFKNGPIKNTSSLLKIAVCKEGIDIEEQELRIREATIFLTNGFIKINQTLPLQEEKIPQFTIKSIINHVARRNNITITQAKKIIDDYILILESGLLLGEKVPIGRLGKIFLKMKHSQKARIGRNPATGEEITIKAKPEKPVPKMSFSRYMKDRSANAGIASDIEEETPDDDSSDE